MSVGLWHLEIREKNNIQIGKFFGKYVLYSAIVFIVMASIVSVVALTGPGTGGFFYMPNSTKAIISIIAMLVPFLGILIGSVGALDLFIVTIIAYKIFSSQKKT